MAAARSFEDLEVWQKARELTGNVYRASRRGEFRKDFSLRDQTTKACVSIMSNIAEGFERGGNVEFLQFLAVAKGSAGEVRSQLYVALDQAYLDDVEFKRLTDLALRTSQMISGLMRYLQKSAMKGPKYANVDGRKR